MAKDFYYTKYPLLGMFLYVLTPLLFVGGAVVVLGSSKLGFLYGLLGLASVVGAGFCFKYARRAKTRIIRSLTGLLQYVKDKKETLIIFLREFSSEGTEGMIIKDNTGDPTSELYVSEEDRLANELEKYGVMVAIGRPGEQLPTSGAYRLYVNDDAWKTTVTELITRADVIVLRCGKSSALSWELKQIAEYQKLMRTIFIPQMDSSKNLSVIRQIRQFTGSSQPDKLSRSMLDGLEFEDEERKKLYEKSSKRSKQALTLLNASQNLLDVIKVSAPPVAPTLYLMEADRPVTFDDPLDQAIPKAFDHMGITYKKFTFSQLKDYVMLLALFAPVLLSGTGQICEWLEMQKCMAFIDTYFGQIFIGMAILFVVLLSLTI